MKMNIKALFMAMAKHEASDLHLCVGLPAALRLFGKLELVGEEPLSNEDVIQMLKSVLPQDRYDILSSKEVDLSIEVEGVRFRVNIYHDKNGLCAAFRLIPTKIKSLRDLGVPIILEKVVQMERGLILITGITGCGKSTTVGSLIDKINNEREAHIITIEDPIEFVHAHKKCIINQREVGIHTGSFPNALRGALREDPDIIYIGEMRDLETISLAITAAETGHLVFGTLHTRGAAQSIDRIIDAFPVAQQEQIRVQLAEVLEVCMSQALIISADGQRRHLAAEVMVVTPAIRNLIREKKTFQIASAIESGANFGMLTLDKSLMTLVSSGCISKLRALPWISDKSKLDKI